MVAGEHAVGRFLTKKAVDVQVSSLGDAQAGATASKR